MRTEHSRALRLAALAAGETESTLEARLNRASVSVSVDPNLPGALEVAELLLETLRRGPGEVSVDPGGLRQAEVERLVAAGAGVSKAGTIEIARPDTDSVRVRIADSAPAGSHCALADGHGMRLRTDGGQQRQLRAPSALGIAFAAAIAAGEIFKTTAGVGPTRCVHLGRLDFCPVSLSEDLTIAPIHVGGPIDLALVGLGAVGTAVARILGGLGFGPASALLIDPETFGLENLGTYSLGTLADIDIPKVKLAAAALDGWSLRQLCGPVEDAIGPIDAGQLPWPRTVICGLDSIKARRAAQGLWPDRMIDGATGDTSVGLHEALTGRACLRCFFPERTPARSAAQLLSEELGLPVELLMRGEKPLEQSQLAGLTEAQRQRLAPQVGKPICGLANAVGLGGDEDDAYMPSVPFVSQQAACLAVGRLLASRNSVLELPNTVQYNTMLGPQRMTKMTRPPRSDCYCRQRAEVIRAVRGERGGPKRLSERARTTGTP